VKRHDREHRDDLAECRSTVDGHLVDAPTVQTDARGAMFDRRARQSNVRAPWHRMNVETAKPATRRGRPNRDRARPPTRLVHLNAYQVDLAIGQALPSGARTDRDPEPGLRDERSDTT
jgi:hypothetical protein